MLVSEGIVDLRLYAVEIGLVECLGYFAIGNVEFSQFSKGL